MTSAQEKIMALAREIALAAPLRQAEYSVEARIPWEVVHELRAALTEAEGFDWRAAHKRYKAEVTQRKKESHNKLYAAKTD